jgi:hypothetical protein
LDVYRHTNYHISESSEEVSWVEFQIVRLVLAEIQRRPKSIHYFKQIAPEYLLSLHRISYWWDKDIEVIFAHVIFTCFKQIVVNIWQFVSNSLSQIEESCEIQQQQDWFHGSCFCLSEFGYTWLRISRVVVMNSIIKDSLEVGGVKGWI